MMRIHGFAEMALTILATLAGIIGTGLIYTAVSHHLLGALLWGLPLALAGLYWCGRNLAQSQNYYARRRVLRRQAQASQQ